MIAKKLTAMMRVPFDEPGLQFFQGKNGKRWLPLQKGCELADEQKGQVTNIDPPEWTKGGNYWVYGADFDDGSKDYAIITVLNNAEMVWLVQANEHYQGQAAKNLVPTFDWRACDPLHVIFQGNLELTKAGTLYPDLKWTLTGRVKDGKAVVLGNDPDMIRTLDEITGEN